MINNVNLTQSRCLLSSLVGDHIQGAFNVSRTPRCGRAASFSRSPSSTIGQLDRGDNSQPSSTNSPVSSTLTPTDTADCKEISKMHAMAVYFLHNKERSRSYYNLDVRNLNGTQKRARSRDLPWAMKQASALHR